MTPQEPVKNEGGGDVRPTASFTGLPEAASERRSLIPERIGSYHIRRIIGSGGMGVVYEAVQEHPRRTVALKVMRAGLASADAMRRFENESQVLSRLQHAGVALVYEAGTHEEPTPGGKIRVPYFAMEYIPNARILTDFAREHGLSVAARLSLFALVADAVDHGHQHGVIHRDLKPGNILVDAAGHPKVIDFGVARSTDADLTLTTRQTDVGQLLGTIQYMSPEQMDADPHAIDTRSDVYSLGVVLYELLLERLPYDLEGSAVLQAASAIRGKTPERPSTINRTVRGDVETIVLKALEKEPAHRYQGVGEMRDDILRYLRDEPIRARRAGALETMARRTRAVCIRRPIAAAAVAAALSGVAAEQLGAGLLARTPAGREIDRVITSAGTSAAASARSLDTVRLIEVREDTDFAAAAASLGTQDTTQASPPSMRPILGGLCDRLAQTGVRTVVFDLYFPNPSPYDDALVNGVEALRSAGIDTVAGVSTWRLKEDGAPEMCPAFAGVMRWGGLTIGAAPDEPVSADAAVAARDLWPMDLAVQMGDREPLLSLSLMAFCCFRNPGYEAAIALDQTAERVQVGWWRPHSSVPRVREWLDHRERIELSSLREEETDAPEVGLTRGDMVGKFRVAMPGEAAIRAATLTLNEAAALPMSELRSRLYGKIALIADTRRGDPGPYLHAAAIESLLKGASVRLPRVAHEYWLTGAGAALGFLLGLASRGRAWRMRLWLVIACATWMIGAVALFRSDGYLMNPLIPILAMVISAESVRGIVALHRAGRTARSPRETLA